MLVKATVIVESTDDELVTTTLPTRIDTKDLNYPTVKWLWEFITRDKLAAAKRKLRLISAYAVQRSTKAAVFIGDDDLNRRSKPRDAFNKALKWFETNYAKLKLTQMCLLLCTNTRDIKIYIQEEKEYVENN